MIKYIAYIFTFVFVTFLSSCDNSKGIEPDNDPIDELDLSSCLTTVSSEEFEIMTWNIKDFPYQGDSTMKMIKLLIEEQKPDVIALQEISSASEFHALTDALPDYENKLIVDGNLNLGFLYKTSEITVEQDIQQIITGDFYAFPRPPVMIKLTHASGFSTALITIHLKCCGGTENYFRRKDASKQLKEYIDTNLPDDEVVILGDFNDEIYGIPDNENPFLNFIEDDVNFEFADMALAMNDKDDWSYPSWPSHIDHILITNELFDSVQETITLSFDDCYDGYFTTVSDHRPIILKLSK